MPGSNSIKISYGGPSLPSEYQALRIGSWYIGTGDVGKGNTLGTYSNGTWFPGTDYWASITPPSGGYTVYGNKSYGTSFIDDPSNQGPSICTIDDDNGLITYVNRLSGQNFTTASASLAWVNTQVQTGSTSSVLIVNEDYGSIITSGLQLHVDAGFVPSCPGTVSGASYWYDLSAYQRHITLPSSLTTKPKYNNDYGTSSFLFSGQMIQTATFLFTPNLGVAFNLWVNPDTTVGIQTNGSHIFSGNYKIIRQNNQTSLLFYTINSSGANTGIIFTNFFVGNQWVNIQASLNYNTNILSIYKNGTLFATSSTWTIGNPSTASFVSKPISLGGNPGGSQQSWVGKISTFSMYDRILSASEVSQNFEAQRSRFGI